MASQYKVTLRKNGATWYYFTENPQGGGFGSNHCGTKGVAMGMALRGLDIGELALVTTQSVPGGAMRSETIVKTGWGWQSA